MLASSTLVPFPRGASASHLGNVRVVATAAGVDEQQNEFYPYGESIDTPGEPMALFSVTYSTAGAT